MPKRLIYRATPESGFFVTICGPSGTGCSFGVREDTSDIKMADFVDGKLCMRPLTRKRADYLDGKMFPISAAKNRGVFLAGKVADKKETPRKDVSTTYTL